MPLLAEVRRVEVHELAQRRFDALRNHGPVLCTAGPAGTSTGAYVAEAAEAEAAGLVFS